MSHVTVTSTLGSALADAGTTTFTLPDPYNESQIAETGHILVVKNGAKYSDGSKDFTISVAGQTVTLTNCTEATIAAGSVLYLQLALRGNDTPVAVPSDLKGHVGIAQVVHINLGTPGTADADGFVESQDLTALGVYSVDTDTDGALAAAALLGEADAEFGRNVVAAWTNAAVITVTGTDYLGNTVVEASASGTSFTGKKAFKTVTAIAVSADVTGLTVGTGTVLGLPVYIPSLNAIIAESIDGANATAGTTVAGILTEPTSTTGDVRGTYVANSAPDGNKAYTLVAVLEDPFNRGSGQYAG